MWIKLNYNIEKLQEKIKKIKNHDLSLFNKTTLVIDLLSSLGNICLLYTSPSPRDRG